MSVEAFIAPFLASLKILAIALAGYLAAAFGMLDRKVLSNISRLLVFIFLPAFIFYHTLSNSSIGALGRWWIFPLIALGIFLLSFVVAYLMAIVFHIKGKSQFIATIVFQNCGYMPLLLISSLFKGEMGDALYVYVFLFLILFNLLIWSLGVYMLSGARDFISGIKKAVNPPFIATVISIILLSFGLNKLIPGFVFDVAQVLGRPVLPLSMMVLGGLLQVNCLTCAVDRNALWLSVFIKLALLPAIGLVFINLIPIDYIMKWFVIVELAVPSAVSLVIITEAYGGDSNFISQVLLYSSLLSIITLPIFLALI